MAELLEHIGQSRLAHNFILIGGTALALQLGHRTSEDLDFFSMDKDTSCPSIADMKAVCNSPRIGTTLRLSDQVHYDIAGIRVTFLQYPFAFHDSPQYFHGVPLASVLDLGAMKAHTIGRRAKIRDYIDLWKVLDSGIGLNDIIERANNLFNRSDQEFSAKSFLAQLTYYDDIPTTDVATIYERYGFSTPWNKVADDIATKVTKYVSAMTHLTTNNSAFVEDAENRADRDEVPKI
ncbi:MAG: nucleotidyl transferase AbiEii/AbiGii toxin family protein [Actinobacteria bacterium]|jgi:predicted nucleotidyltransferase component of viral defense system|nr:nucleotidyl transferase AbiEii/AbiGii toxin family protein [Actinomycetota bacterium]